MAEKDPKKLLATRDRHEKWLMEQPGVARTGVELSNRTGDPCLKIYTKEMPTVTRRSIIDKLGKEAPVEFTEVKPGDEVIPY